jgi:hypothetical protein
MKKAIVSYQGFVSKIVDPGEETDIYEGPDATFVWVDAPDNVQMDWTLEWSPSQQQMIWVERDGPFTDNAVARKVAYGEVGAQLGMLYDELKANGSISTDGEWFQHISMVKAVIDKPVYQEPITLEEMMARAATEEPSATKPCQASTMEMPAWRRYPGWKGFDPASN